MNKRSLQFICDRLRYWLDRAKYEAARRDLLQSRERLEAALQNFLRTPVPPKPSRKDSSSDD